MLLCNALHLLLITIWNSGHVKYEHSPQYVTVVQKINKNIIGPLKVKSYTQRQTTNNRKHAHNIKHTFLYTLAYVQSSSTHRHIKDESRSKPHNKENTHTPWLFTHTCSIQSQPVGLTLHSNICTSRRGNISERLCFIFLFFAPALYLVFSTSLYPLELWEMMGKNRKMDEMRGKVEESKRQKIEEKKGEGRMILILSTSAVNSSVLLFFIWRIIITSLIIASIDFMKLYNRCNVMVIDYPAKIWQHNQNCTSFL